MINLSLQLYCFTLKFFNILSGELSSKNLDILDKILDVDIKKKFTKKRCSYGLSKYW